MSNSLSSYQFRQSLKSLVGQEPSGGWGAGDDAQAMLEDYQAVVSDGLLSCPVDPYKMSVVPERLAIFTDVNRRQRSLLFQILQDRSDQAVIAVDSYLTGKDAIHLVAVVESIHDVDTWVESMNKSRLNLTLRPINDAQKLMIVPLSSFVPNDET